MSAERVPFTRSKRPDSSENVFVIPTAEQDETGSAAELLRDLDAQMKRDKTGARATPVPVSTMRQHLADWIFEAKFANQSPRTLEGKQDAIERFLWWAENKTELTELTRMDFKRYLHYVSTAHLTPAGRWDQGRQCANGATHRAYRPVSDRTVQLYFVYIKEFLNFLARDEVIPESPLAGVRQPKIGKRIKAPLSVEDDIAALLDAAHTSRASHRDVALLVFLLDTGARVSEVCGIKLQDVDMDAGTVMVIGKGNKERPIHFELETARLLRAYLKRYPCKPQQPLFRAQGGKLRGQGMTRRGIRNIFVYLKRKAGITNKQVSPHRFRHAFATELAKSGCPAKAIQEMLGHKTMEMTMRYIHSTETETREFHREHSVVRRLRRKAKGRPLS